MSTHPNAILMLVLTPDDLSRKTLRSICDHMSVDPSEESFQWKVGGKEYSVTLLEESYDDGYQIGASEGDILVHDYLTYGYGEKIAWEKVEAQKFDLEQWAEEICDKFHCKQQIFITANYW